MRPTRQFWVVCHRWAGLTIALFLTVAGFTGIFLAWIDEIEGAISPQLFHVAAPYEGARPLAADILRSRVLARYPGGVIDTIPLRYEAGRSVLLSVERIDLATGQQTAWSRDWDQLFVDPYTGKELGRRKWGDLGQGFVNLMPFVYRLHYSLALGGYGSLAFGIAALIWTLDSFVGLYLTLPVRIRRMGAAPAGGQSWWRRWKASWIVRWGSSSYKLNFDLHRAGGLWIWPMLLVFAWSSVAFTLTPVYAPVMKLFGAEDVRERLAPLARPRPHPKLDFAAAAKRGSELASAEMARRGVRVDADGSASLRYLPSAGVYLYAFTSARDFTAEGGRSGVLFDSDTGALRAVDLPQGENSANSFTNWIMALHMGMVFGLPYRIIVSLIGAMVTTLSVTGVVIWTKKRSGRIGRKTRLSSQRTRLLPAE